MSQVEQSDNGEKKGRKRRFRVTRRGFLIGAGVTGATLALGVYFGREPYWRNMANNIENGEVGGEILDNQPFLWFEVTENNQILMINPKVEMGQGVHTAMAQIAAEELAIRWDQMTVQQGGTADEIRDGRGTGASNSITSSYQSLRQAGATMREMLKIAGADLLGLPPSDVEAFEGTVRASSNLENGLTYGEIVSQTSEWPELTTEPALKPVDQYQLIGRSLPRVDFETKMRGEAIYGYDMRLPDMLYGAVARPPTLEATLTSASAGEILSRPGVVDFVIDVENNFAGVVAETRQQAQAALSGFELEWDRGKLWEQAEILAQLKTTNQIGVAIQDEGAALRQIGRSPTAEAVYSTPFAVHAHLEPQAALADVKPDRVRIWTSTQGPGFVQGAVAGRLGVEAETVQVLPNYLGGGFGRKIGSEVGIEASLLSQKVGRPVHVGWSRAEDIRNGFLRPATKSALSGKVENGQITAINHNHSSGEVAFRFFPDFLELIFGTDFGAWRGAFNFYGEIPNRRLSTHLAQFPVPTGWWRGLGLLANVFATESFMDELAHAAGADPLQFRLDHLANDTFGGRMGRVLTTAAEAAGYGGDLPEGHAHGIACCTDVNTLVALVVELSVDENGVIQVHRAVQAVDAGLVINPDGAIAQAQGSIVMGLSSTLIEEITIEEGRIVQSNFDRYPLITNSQTPDIEIVLVPSGDEPFGLGEPPIGPVAAAVGNALFNLTGKRLRELPFTPERVLAA